MGKYIEVQNKIILDYNINLCNGEFCKSDWPRTHAHVKDRRVCKWSQSNSIQSTFTLFHEIGHIETTKSKMRRCESEYYATVWALVKLKELNITVPNSILVSYQEYIDMEHYRGIRRHGNLPELSNFSLDTLK